MSAEEAVELLAGNGMLIKRPFFILGDTVLIVFMEARLEKIDL